MKNLKKLSDQTNFIILHGAVPLYYSIKEDAVYSEAGEGRFYLTDLIRYNTEDEIAETVRYFLSL